MERPVERDTRMVIQGPGCPVRLAMAAVLLTLMSACASSGYQEGGSLQAVESEMTWQQEPAQEAGGQRAGEVELVANLETLINRLPNASTRIPAHQRISLFEAFSSSNQAGMVTARAEEEEALNFTLTPFLWVPGLDGQVGIKGVKANVDMGVFDFGETLIEDLRIAALATLEGRHGKWSFILRTVYLGLTQEKSLGPIDIDIDFDQLLMEFWVGYRFAELPLGKEDAGFTPSLHLEGQVGLRLTKVWGELDLDPGPSFDDSKGWVDPAVGLRAIFQVSPELSFILWGQIGGFDVGSNLFWVLQAGLSYEVSKSVSLVAGWAIFDIDYEDGGFTYDLQMSGPYLGAMFRF